MRDKRIISKKQKNDLVNKNIFWHWYMEVTMFIMKIINYIKFEQQRSRNFKHKSFKEFNNLKIT